ncbi:hypothetical protein [Trinickia fusca]|uniref:Uncharacterized protein n=1 Tax=Trinickia fusca TaxID=2419777 RepID=A0A494XLZ9_9BURK|nr:hypothetical protein [Trinickia fusca]RKP49084.1 hypothetical protein D7S89_09765 [Trinickia fusca]
MSQPASRQRVPPQAKPPHPPDFPDDLFEDGDLLAPRHTECLAWFGQRPQIAKRLAVHRVRGRTAKTTAVQGIATTPPEFFGIYVSDEDGNEHPLLDFVSAPSAVYAAMRIAQVYRLGLEFGNFALPKTRIVRPSAETEAPCLATAER